MNKSKSLRVTIPKHHTTYINALASQMGCNSSEALNYLLWESRKSNFQFGSDLPPQTQNILNNPYYDSSTFESQATNHSCLNFIPQSPQAIQEFEHQQQLSDEIDPVISRLIAAGLELDF